MNTSKVISLIKKQGWCPVKYGHHPSHVKDAIRLSNFRPQAKQCFYNSQQLIIRQDEYNFLYVEGIVKSLIPIIHAWVIDEKGYHHDITLNPPPEIYRFKIYTKNEIINNMIKTKTFCPIDENWLNIMQHAAIIGISSEKTFEDVENEVKNIMMNR